MRRGQQAAARGDRHAARRWLDRACRLARADDTLALMLATYCLGEDDPRAAELFARVLVANDVREAWLGLALARLRLNEPDAASAAVRPGGAGSPRPVSCGSSRPEKRRWCWTDARSPLRACRGTGDPRGGWR
jgi:TPR repeat protein